MSKNKKKSLSLILRNYFITGIVVLVPIGFTLYLSKILIGLSSKLIPENINPTGREYHHQEYVNGREGLIVPHARHSS